MQGIGRFVSGLVLVAWAATRATAAEDLTPGAVAKGLLDKDKPEVGELWARALADPRPELRAAAARAIDVAGADALLPKVQDALAKETDRGAAVEEMEALAFLGADQQALLTRAKALGLNVAFARALASVRGQAAIPFVLSHAADLGLRRADWSRFFAFATRGEATAFAIAASMSLGRKDPEIWGGLLDALHDSHRSLERGVTTAALGSPAAEVRAQTAWFLSLQLPDAAIVSRPDLLAALEAARAQPAPSDADQAFGLELLGRALGKPAVESPAWISRLADARAICWPSPAGGMTDGERTALLYLSKGELAALSTRLTGRKEALADWIADSSKNPFPIQPTGDPGLHTVSGYPRGLVTSLLTVTGCTLTRGPVFAVGAVVYGPDRRPREAVVASVTRTECKDASKVLFLMARAPERRRPLSGQAETVIVALHPDCLDGVEAVLSGPRADVRRLGGDALPRQTKRVEPAYPKDASGVRKEGIVTLDALLTASGCVGDVSVLKGIDAPLDAAAIQAVSGWRYEPPLLDGVAAPAAMTLTLPFHPQ